MLGAALVGAVLASGRGAALADNECKPPLEEMQPQRSMLLGDLPRGPVRGRSMPER